MSILNSAILAIAIAAESALVGATENVTSVICAPPNLTEASMPLDKLIWRVEGSGSAADEISIGLSFPSDLDGLKFEMLEAIVDTGKYKFEITPTISKNRFGEQGSRRLDFHVNLQRGAASNVKFEFTYSKPAKHCTDELRVFSLEASEALNSRTEEGHESNVHR
ncbi:MAG TPA: hypothetical protein VHL14_12475 [Steroidobacteraceae bacterium]|jgi:hypothetical protein|nr:hypothetical protein [Steroidobacteraceae bacterium]